jgi:hypothetical protein
MLFRVEQEQDDSFLNLKLEGWVSPKADVHNWLTVVKGLEKELRKLTYEASISLGFKKFIVDVDLRSSGIKLGKKSYLKTNIVLEQKDKIDIDRLLGYYNYFFESNCHFEMTPEK